MPLNKETKPNHLLEKLLLYSLSLSYDFLNIFSSSRLYPTLFLFKRLSFHFVGGGCFLFFGFLLLFFFFFFYCLYALFSLTHFLYSYFLSLHLDIFQKSSHWKLSSLLRLSCIYVCIHLYKCQSELASTVSMATILSLESP